MILKILLNTQITRRIFIKTLKNTTQIKLNPILTKLFIGGRKLNISLFLTANLVLLYEKILD